jgi:hypothetical protein
MARTPEHCNTALTSALTQAGGIQPLAATSGIPQRTLYYRVRKLGCLSFDQAKLVASVYGLSVAGLQEPPR